jgi:DNA-binding response OmpR family regulator
MNVVTSLLIVDDDEDLREVIVDVTLRLGIERHVLAAGLAQVQLQRDQALATGLAIIDVNLGPGHPTGVEVCEWLRREGFRNRIVFFTGHAEDDPRVIAAASVPGARIMTKPISISELHGLLQGK